MVRSNDVWFAKSNNARDSHCAFPILVQGDLPRVRAVKTIGRERVFVSPTSMMDYMSVCIFMFESENVTVLGCNLFSVKPRPNVSAYPVVGEFHLSGVCGVTFETSVTTYVYNKRLEAKCTAYEYGSDVAMGDGRYKMGDSECRFSMSGPVGNPHFVLSIKFELVNDATTLLYSQQVDKMYAMIKLLH